MEAANLDFSLVAYAANDCIQRTVTKSVPESQLTLLMGSAQGTGDITLNQSYKNFDALLVIAGNDSQQSLHPVLWPVWLFDFMLEFCKDRSKTLYLTCLNFYWIIDPAKTTETVLKCSSENSIIIAVYGLKYNNDLGIST